MNFSILLFFLVAIVVSSKASKNQNAAVTVTVNSYVFCATVTTPPPANVTDCRRRRQYWIDGPFYIALNDPAADELAQFLNPTQSYQVEPTFKINSQQVNYYYPDFETALIPSGMIQPSWSDEKQVRYPSIVGIAAALSMVKNKLTMIASLVPFNANANLNVTTITTTINSTLSLIHSGCNPPSLPFPTCL